MLDPFVLVLMHIIYIHTLLATRTCHTRYVPCRRLGHVLTPDEFLAWGAPPSVGEFRRTVGMEPKCETALLHGKYCGAARSSGR